MSDQNTSGAVNAPDDADEMADTERTPALADDSAYSLTDSVRDAIHAAALDTLV